MATLPAGCVLCGASINPRLAVWMGHFRALYLRNGLRPDQDEVQLSGVGHRDEHHGIDQAPLDRDVRYYQNNFQPESLRNFGLLSEDYGRPLQIPTQRGIPFHFACWEILERVAGDEPIDLKTMWLFFLDFPLQNGKVNWGHDYGFIPYQQVSRDSQGFERIFCDSFDEGREQEMWTIWDRDPTETLPVSAAIRIAHSSKLVPALPVTERSATTTDRFRQLPQEIRDIILFQLPSRDVLALKLSSRSFAESELGDAFWASRFAPDKEMGHVFEVHTITYRRSNWRDIYFEFLSRRTPKLALQNRRRIWTIASDLLETIKSVKQGSKLEGTDCGAPRKSAMFDVWAAEANILSCDPDFEEIFSNGARMRPGLTRYIRSVERSCRITVSFINLPAGRFISGLTMQNIVDHNMHQIGFIHPDNQLILPLSERDDGKLFDLYGLELAVGTQGFLGMRCLGMNDEKGPWIGEHEGVPKKLLPFKGTGSILLTCNFDSMKLLSLWSSHLANASSATFSRKLRENSKWYPEIPASHHHLLPLVPTNKFSQGNTTNNFLPNEVLYFGGNHGERLAHVTGLRIWIDDGDLAGMGFAFDDNRPHHDDTNSTKDVVDDNQVPWRPEFTKANTLGRAERGLLKPEEVVVNTYHSRQFGYAGPSGKDNGNKVKQFDFLIDGPGEERIVKIEVGLNWRNGRMVAPKIDTNFGRAFIPDGWSECPERSTIEVLGQDERLIGLYARRNHSGAFTSMGGITTIAPQETSTATARSAVEQIRGTINDNQKAGSSNERNETIEQPAAKEEGSSETGLEKLLGELEF